MTIFLWRYPSYRLANLWISLALLACFAQVKPQLPCHLGQFCPLKDARGYLLFLLRGHFGTEDHGARSKRYCMLPCSSRSFYIGELFITRGYQMEKSKV